MPEVSDKDIPPASARALGAAVRKTLKAMGLPWKVKSETVSFSGFGYGSAPFAKISTERLLTYIECSKLADTLRELRSNGTGKGIIQLEGRDYAFGGAIHAKDDPSGADFWRQLHIDLVVTPEKDRKVTPVIRESERRVLLAYQFEIERPDRPRRDSLRQDIWCKAWIDSGMENPEAWGEGWPEIYKPEEMPPDWPGIMHFERQPVRPIRRVICFAVPCLKPAKPGDVDAIAVDDTGRFITAQVCSGPGWARHDLGVDGGDHYLRFHGWFYNKRFPGGVELRWSDTPPENWDGQREHTDDTLEPWHLDPVNESTWRKPVKEEVTS